MGSKYGRILNIQEWHRVLKCHNMTESVWIYNSRHSSEYVSYNKYIVRGHSTSLWELIERYLHSEFCIRSNIALWTNNYNFYFHKTLHLKSWTEFCLCVRVLNIPRLSVSQGSEFVCFFLIRIHCMEGWTAPSRHGVTRKRSTKRLKHRDISLERIYSY